MLPCFVPLFTINIFNICIYAKAIYMVTKCEVIEDKVLLKCVRPSGPIVNIGTGPDITMKLNTYLKKLNRINTSENYSITTETWKPAKLMNAYVNAYKLMVTTLCCIYRGDI